MNLFGKKPAAGEKGSKDKPKKKPQKIKRKYKTPSDVKLFYIMPGLLIIGLACIAAGVFIVHKNSVAYNEQILASSMAKGENLYVRSGNAEGNLTLGNTLLSADGKTLAVEIRYDDASRRQLSAFGDNYNLYLVDTEENKMEDAELSYGMFGTDGSGVLTVHREEGFQNKAFMVFILDKGVLVTSEDLQTGRTMSDAEISQSLARQLAQIEESNSATSETKNERMPPTYVVRLNASSSDKSYRNWKNDRELVEDLFVDRNMKSIQKNKEDLEEKIEAGEQTLDEMEKRLEKNPDDNTALSSKQDIENQLKRLNDELDKAEANYTKIMETTIETGVLEPKQTEFDRFTVIDLNRVR